MTRFHSAIGRSPRSNSHSETVTKSTQPFFAQAATSQPFCREWVVGHGRRRPDHRADFGRVIHALGIDADQHRIHAAAVVRHLLDVTLEIFHGDRHRSLTASLGVHAFTTVEIVEHAARAVLLGGIPRRIRPGNLCE